MLVFHRVVRLAQSREDARNVWRQPFAKYYSGPSLKVEPVCGITYSLAVKLAILPRDWQFMVVKESPAINVMDPSGRSCNQAAAAFIVPTASGKLLLGDHAG